MNIREQVLALIAHGVEYVVVGGQAGVLRQAIEFSFDLDILIRATGENAERVRRAVREITHLEADSETLLGRDFQQYIDPETETELDVHLKLIAIPDYPAAVRHSSPVDFLGVPVPVLELPALYASKRTDRPRDALHRTAIENRIRQLVREGRIEVDDIVLALCLDPTLAGVPRIAESIEERAGSTVQPLLQTRLVAFELAPAGLARNPRLHPTPRALRTLDPAARARLVAHPARLAALLARVPLLLPEEGYRLTWR